MRILLTLLLLFSSSAFLVYAADTPTPTPSPSPTPNPSGTPAPTGDQSQQIQDLNNKIQDLESKISDLHTQEDSLSSQIEVMDNQVKLTQYRIDATKEQINEVTQDIGIATKRMKNLEGSLSDVTKVLINRIIATYQAGGYQPMQVLLASNDITDFFSRENYLKIVQEHDKELIYATQQTKDDYANQKTIFENKKQQIEALQTQLQTYTTQLGQQKDAKQKLLTDTQGSEENYQRILQQTKAQLAGFSRFVSSQGGASLLSNQTVCDNWGCYYNQRDSQWGANALNGTQYTIADSGCLMTSVAMVYTHYGHKDVTPQSINAVSDNFGGIPPALLKYNITANGTSSQRVGASIDPELANGNPVIVGISYDGGPYPDHFVVLISGASGSYQMNDPFTPNGHDIPFTDHYSVASIREIDKVIM